MPAVFFIPKEKSGGRKGRRKKTTTGMETAALKSTKKLRNRRIMEMTTRACGNQKYLRKPN